MARDRLDATAGVDEIRGLGSDILVGLDGDDNILGNLGDNGFDDLGDDTDLGSLRVINGGSGPDNLIGTDEADTINGFRDDDTIIGRDGDDDLLGRGGADTILGEEGNDDIDGGKGEDTLEGGAGDDDINGRGGADEIDGGDGEDTIFSKGGNDEVDGGDDDDIIFGGGGRDRLAGGDGDDLLIGQNSSDFLDGGAGEDSLDGGRGNDRLRGGDGDDNFRFREDSGGLDRILDFDPGASDSLADGDLVSIDADVFDRTPIRANTAGFVRVEDQGDDAVIQIDRDGNGDDFQFADYVVLTDQAGIDLTITITEATNSVFIF